MQIVRTNSVQPHPPVVPPSPIPPPATPLTAPHHTPSSPKSSPQEPFTTPRASSSMGGTPSQAVRAYMTCRRNASSSSSSKENCHVSVSVPLSTSSTAMLPFTPIAPMMMPTAPSSTAAHTSTGGGVGSRDGSTHKPFRWGDTTTAAFPMTPVVYSGMNCTSSGSYHFSSSHRSHPNRLNPPSAPNTPAGTACRVGVDSSISSPTIASSSSTRDPVSLHTNASTQKTSARHTQGQDK